MKTVLLYSGGADSTVLLYDLLDRGEKVLPVMFDYGQPHVVEIDHAMHITSTLGLVATMVDLPTFLGDTTDGVIFPNRNAVMVSVAAAYALTVGAHQVAFAAHGDDHDRFPDCRRDWAYAMRSATEKATSGAVSFYYPYLSWTKAEVVMKGNALGVPFDLTWSCYLPGPDPCGTCLACEAREAVFG